MKRNGQSFPGGFLLLPDPVDDYFKYQRPAHSSRRNCGILKRILIKFE